MATIVFLKKFHLSDIFWHKNDGNCVLKATRSTGNRISS